MMTSEAVIITSLALAVAACARDIVPLYDAGTPREPATTVHTADALVTRVGDRARDRHAREAKFRAYDHYLSWYWEERTAVIEIVDRIAKGGKEIVINIQSQAPLGAPDFRCFFRGINTVAEYFHNVRCEKVGPNRYTATVRHNAKEGRALQIGDRMEFEFSQFLEKPANGRANYYGTTMLYIVGRGIVPWRGEGELLDSFPLPESAWLGGATTLPYQYSAEPEHRFKQMAGNIAPVSAQSFLLGRRLHHTDFGSGAHSEKPNPDFPEQAGKLGPRFAARSCVACHVNNGRALAQSGKPLSQSVIKLPGGAALQAHSVDGTDEIPVTQGGFVRSTGEYADGAPWEMIAPTYRFTGVKPEKFSVRIAPQLVGLGLLEAVPESAITKLADPDDTDGDGISGRMQVVPNPKTGQPRLGRFGYKAAQSSVRQQVADALFKDMGVTSSVLGEGTELADQDLDHLTRYISLLGVSARRDLDDPQAQRGEKVFSQAGCAKCHLPELKTGEFHPLAELRGQTIRPFTDLLLHDMGPALDDGLGEGRAGGSEWRTAPLWNIGLTNGVSGGEGYLHDGRARSLEESILWHGGEGMKSRKAFIEMPAADRAALLAFLKSL